MVCQSCQKEVDNDLVFCTECGSRLHETVSNAQTIIIPKSVVTQQTQITPKPNSNLKWIALTIGLIAIIAIPSAIGIGYLILNRQKTKQVATNKTPTNSPTPRKTPNHNPPVNVGSNVNSVNNSNTNSWEHDNSNTESNSDDDESEIITEKISLAPDEHIAFPFELQFDAKIIGKIVLLQGDGYEGFVYSQESYDNHFPDSTFKMFSFGEENNSKFEQYLPKGDYVIVFINSSESGVTLQADFSQISQ